MSLPEVLLWNLLRKSPGGVRFRRQHPLGKYILDFYCAAAKVCIELDGLSHDAGDQPERDEQRDAWLDQQGIDVIRIPAAEVLKSPADVAEAVVRYCQR
jgi:very-short-patch-repair endonuclease